METTATERRYGHQVQQLIESLTTGKHFRQHPFLRQGLSFGQLYDRAAAIRKRSARTLEGSHPLCLCSDNRADMAAALLASLAGGPALLIPHDYTEQVLQQAREARPYTHALVNLGSALPPDVNPILLPHSGQPGDQDKAEPLLALDATWLYLFTGGSTGAPKVWSKSPRNLLAEALNLSETYGITHKDTILSTVPNNHIYGLLYAVLLPLVSGAKVCLRTPCFPHEIIQGLEETRATVLISIPAHYRALKKQPITRHRVCVAFSSAGALDEQDGIEFTDNTGIPITEIYGSTETGGIAQRNRSEGQTAFHPFECVNVRIEDTHLKVKSEFLSDKLRKDTAGFFQTADRAHWESPSGFMLLGRSDGIVKVGGKRVDLAVIREALLRVDGVRDVYVLARPVRSTRENEIVALVEGNAMADQLHQAAKSILPPYALPRSIKTTPKIPLSPAGKYNRTAIQKIFDADS
jgi:acyl-coenzyme A synthetase/AMP-(fatty) acid ligase